MNICHGQKWGVQKHVYSERCYAFPLLSQGIFLFQSGESIWWTKIRLPKVRLLQGMTHVHHDSWLLSHAPFQPQDICHGNSWGSYSSLSFWFPSPSFLSQTSTTSLPSHGPSWVYLLWSFNYALEQWESILSPSMLVCFPLPFLSILVHSFPFVLFCVCLLRFAS